MNAKKFSDAMSELDSKYIDEALNYKKKAKKPVWVKWGAMAACLCLIVVGGLGISRVFLMAILVCKARADIPTMTLLF